MPTVPLPSAASLCSNGLSHRLFRLNAFQLELNSFSFFSQGNVTGAVDGRGERKARRSEKTIKWKHVNAKVDFRGDTPT